MAATAGAYGARKGVTVTFPRLTGRAILQITEHLANHRRGDISSDVSIFLTGVLLCNMWAKNKENLIPGYLYDMNFIGSRDNPVECVKSYMRRQGIHDDKFDDAMENSLRMGYITYDPLPYVGYLTLLNKNGDPLEEDENLHATIPGSKYDLTYIRGNFSEEDLYRGFLMRMLATQRYADGVPGDKWDWDTLIVAATDNHELNQGPNPLLTQQRDDLVRRGLPIPPELQEDLDIERERVELGNVIYGDLDNIVRKMITEGDIYANGQLVAKAVLTWD